MSQSGLPTMTSPATTEGVVLQVVGTSDLPPQPAEPAIKESSQTLQIHSPNVGEKMANEAASIEEAKLKESDHLPLR